MNIRRELRGVLSRQCSKVTNIHWNSHFFNRNQSTSQFLFLELLWPVRNGPSFFLFGSLGVFIVFYSCLLVSFSPFFCFFFLLQFLSILVLSQELRNVLHRAYEKKQGRSARIVQNFALEVNIFCVHALSVYSHPVFSLKQLAAYTLFALATGV